MSSLLVIFMSLFLYCSNRPYQESVSIEMIEINQSDAQIDSLETKIFERIDSLKRVKVLKEINQYPIVFIIKKKPSKELKFYHIQVCINSELRLEPIYNFYYDIVLDKLSYYAPVDDSLIDVSKWDEKKE